MVEGLEFLFSGIVLGLAVGTFPGPILALVISETLKYRKKEGIKIAISPLIAELPIVLFVLLILSNLMKYGLLIGTIPFFGACYLIYLGLKNLRVRPSVFGGESAREDCLKRGLIAPILNPNPYLFWLSIGGPKIFKSLDIHLSATVLFLLGFYTLLIGSNIAVALITEKSRFFVGSKHLLCVVHALGIVLILFALIFVRDGIKSIGLF